MLSVIIIISLLAGTHTCVRAVYLNGIKLIIREWCFVFFVLTKFQVGIFRVRCRMVRQRLQMSRNKGGKNEYRTRHWRVSNDVTMRKQYVYNTVRIIISGGKFEKCLHLFRRHRGFWIIFTWDLVSDLCSQCVIIILKLCECNTTYVRLGNAIFNETLGQWELLLFSL